MASAPSFTACWIRCAWTCASSCGGVSQSTSILMWFFSPSYLAAASAPVRAARKTGFVELFAMTAIRSVLSLRAAVPEARPAVDVEESDLFALGPQASTPAATTAMGPNVRKRIIASESSFESIVMQQRRCGSAGAR